MKVHLVPKNNIQNWSLAYFSESQCLDWILHQARTAGDEFDIPILNPAGTEVYESGPISVLQVISKPMG